MRCSMQDIFDAHFDGYAQQHALHPRESRAAWCIRHCGTSTMGSHTLACPEGHFEQLQHHACRHRSCPRCAGRPRQIWIDSQLARLLPCPHFHVVFTLPHVLLPLWSFNRMAMATLLFDCVRDCLLQLMADPKRLGVRPGLLMALHTWGRNLSQHPHIHCLLSAGGIDPNGQWKAGCAGFLLPLKPLQILFRGKLLARLKALLSAQSLCLPPRQDMPHWLACIRKLYTEHWNIEIQAPYDHARGVALYLARYVKGGPVPNDRPLSIDTRGFVRMPYTDHRDGRTKTLCLTAHEFIARVLWHAPPKGLHTVRYAGLYSCARPEQYHAAVGGQQPEPNPTSHAATDKAADTPPKTVSASCPTCQRPLLTRWLHRTAHHVGEISLLQSAAPRTTSSPLGPTHRSNGHSTAGRWRRPCNLPSPAAGC
jgi:Putative transposase/Transposase zinc-binding domain